MAWTQPGHTRAQVDAAGRQLVRGYEDPENIFAFLDALSVVNNWRTSHSFPLNTFAVYLRKRSRQIDDASLVAQRIKRLPSITHKLERFRGLRLSQLQDIGGCRAVLSDVEKVGELIKAYRGSDIKHHLVKVDDYIARPQLSGYRGVHLIYRYNSDRTEVYNGLKIEIQVRSELQHAWATAVETVGTFIRQALKSSQGEAEWLKFFALMGTATAYLEGTAPVADTPQQVQDLVQQLRRISLQLDVINRLRAYGDALRQIEDVPAGTYYTILELDPAERTVSIRGYSRRELTRAQDAYVDAEKLIAERPGAEVVLVSTDSVAALRKAYPNYFLDTRLFIELVEAAFQLG